jgi:hypothetical protein
MKFSRLSLSVSLFALVAASAAFAMPKVGDSATLDGTLVGQGVNAKVTTNQKITAFNANTGVYTVLQTQTIAGQSQSKEVQVASGDMMSEETAAMVVQACESQAIGKKETVNVGAGAFDTCRVAGNDGAVIWIAPVPFGVVKLQTAISVGTINLGMSSFVRGN